MEKGIKKISYKVFTLVLCLCIVFGAVAPAYADDSTSGYSYYRAGSTLNPYTQHTGKNSADMIGRLLDVSSYNQAMIYNRLLQMSSSGSDLTTVNSYITAIDSKLGVIRDSLGIGSSLENVLSNQTSNLQHLNTIINKLSYWDNSHGRSYDLSEMIFNIMNYNSDIVENTSSIPAIVDNTSVIKTNTNRLINIDTTLNKLNSIVNSPFYYILRYDINQGTSNLQAVNAPSGYVYQYSSVADGSYRLNGIRNINNLFELLPILHNDTLNLQNQISTAGTVYDYDYKDNDLNTVNKNKSYSIQDSLWFLNNNINDLLSKIAFVSADSNTISSKLANQDQEQAVLSNFTGSGAASASVSDFGAVKDSMVDLKAGFNGGASSSDTFSFLSGDSNAWDWFTQDTADDVDRTQRSNTRLLRSSSDVASDTPLLDSYYTSILSILGGD